MFDLNGFLVEKKEKKGMLVILTLTVMRRRRLKTSLINTY